MSEMDNNEMIDEIKEGEPVSEQPMDKIVQEVVEAAAEMTAHEQEPIVETVQEEPVAEAAEVVAETAVEEPVAEPVVEEVVEEAKPVEVKPEPVKEEIKVAAVQSETKKAKPASENSVARNDRKVRVGTVISDKMNKTIVVAVKSRYKHPLYKKTVSKTTKFKAHDEKNECGVGDTVEIAETRHISKDKYFRLVRIVEKAK